MAARNCGTVPPLAALPVVSRLVPAEVPLVSQSWVPWALSDAEK